MSNITQRDVVLARTKSGRWQLALFAVTMTQEHQTRLLRLSVWTPSSDSPRLSVLDWVYITVTSHSKAFSFLV